MLSYNNYIEFMCMQYGTWIYNNPVEFLKINNCWTTI